MTYITFLEFSIPLMGCDLAPEWAEQEFPLHTVLGQLTFEITLLHMDL